MAAETKALEELPELIIGILIVSVLGFLFTLSYNPNLLYSEIYTTEVSAISSILPKDTTVRITFDEEITFENLEENTFVISVEDEYLEEESREIPTMTSIKQEQNTIIITKN